MFAKIVGRRITALATTLAVVVGLAITPAFTATAAEGDEPVIAAQTTEVLAEETPPAEVPAPVEEAPAAPAPVEELPAEVPAEELPDVEVPAELIPADASTPPAPESMMRSSVSEPSSLMAVQAAGINPSSIGDFVVGAPVDIQFSGVNADRWRVVLDGFRGVDMSESGHLTGRFARVGAHSLTVQAQNWTRGWFGIWGWETVASERYTFSVLPAVLTNSLPDATVGVAYNQRLDATRNDQPFVDDVFTVSSGSLPPGLTLNRSTGRITGTVSAIPSNPVTYSFSVRLAHDPWIGTAHSSAPQPLSITVGYPAPVVTTTTLPIATVGTAYPATQLTASGDGVITWTATGLPAGLSLDSATGIISGTPEYNVSYGAVTVLPVTVIANNGRASAPQAMSITVNTPAPLFGSKFLPSATVGVAYDQQLPVSNRYGALGFTLVGNSVLPAGLQLTADGRITGTPEYDATAGASKQFIAKVRVDGTAGWDRQGFILNLLTQAPTIETDALADGWLKQPYSQAITTTGPGVTVTVEYLPRNLTFDGSTITGKSRTAGTFPVKITAVNTANSVTKWVDLTINDVPELFAKRPAKVETGTMFAFTPRVDGVGVSLSLGADAPAGMTINQNGRIKWTPATAGTYAFTVTATNPAGTDTQRYVVKVLDAPVLTQGALDDGVIAMPYRQKLSHDGTNVKFQIIAGALPNGMTLTKNGVIKGVATEAGSFDFRVRAKNAIGVDREWFSITVHQPSATLSTGSVIRGNSVTVSGSGYLPGDQLELWLHSTPVLLGTVTATNGTFTSTVVIPANTPAGAHHLVVSGAQSGTQSVPLTVALPAAAVTPAAPQPPRATTPSQSPQLTVTPSEETTVVDESDEADDTEVEENEAEEDLPTLNEPEADGETTAVTPVNWTAALVAAFALLLAALALWFILWRRRRAADS